MDDSVEPRAACEPKYASGSMISRRTVVLAVVTAVMGIAAAALVYGLTGVLFPRPQVTPFIGI